MDGFGASTGHDAVLAHISNPEKFQQLMKPAKLQDTDASLPTACEVKDAPSWVPSLASFGWNDEFYPSSFHPSDAERIARDGTPLGNPLPCATAQNKQYNEK